MQNNTNSLIFGVSFIIFGILLLLNNADIVDLGDFWGLFLFVPGFVSLLVKKANFVNISSMSLGITIMLGNYFSFDLVVPVVFMSLGFGLLLNLYLSGRKNENKRT